MGLRILQPPKELIGDIPQQDLSMEDERILY